MAIFVAIKKFRVIGSRKKARKLRVKEKLKLNSWSIQFRRKVESHKLRPL